MVLLLSCPIESLHGALRPFAKKARNRLRGSGEDLLQRGTLLWRKRFQHVVCRINTRRGTPDSDADSEKGLLPHSLQYREHPSMTPCAPSRAYADSTEG